MTFLAGAQQSRKIGWLLAGIGLAIVSVTVTIRARHRLYLIPSAPDCPAAVVAVVESSQHRLWLCHDGKPTLSFPVRLGQGGLGKRAEGDRRTPLGRYRLGRPRPSERFGTFIPVGYPTPAQRAEGFTGSAIGVHGTSKILSWAGELTTIFDTTDGCIAVGREDQLAAIAAVVRSHASPEILIR